MAKNNLNDIYDDLNDLPNAVRVKNLSSNGSKTKIENKSRKTPLSQVTVQMLEEERSELETTYKAARSEAVWLYQSLHQFFQQRWFDDILSMVKGGKEASVYVCKGNDTTHQAYIAAKVYRPQMFRSLKNDVLYREGREHLDADGNQVLDGGVLRAIARKTRRGRQYLHTSWIEHEVQTMRNLYEAGADVPAYYASGDNAILMEYIGDVDQPAPTLIDVRLPHREAVDLYDRVLENICIMLANHRVHGDLSAYNILYWEGAITLIDFPQAIDPDKNRSAYLIFQRDVKRVTQYFAQQSVRTPDPDALARRLWHAYGYPFAHDVDLRLLDDDDPEDRAFWERLQRQ